MYSFAPKIVFRDLLFDELMIVQYELFSDCTEREYYSHKNVFTRNPINMRLFRGSCQNDMYSSKIQNLHCRIQKSNQYIISNRWQQTLSKIINLNNNLNKSQNLFILWCILPRFIFSKKLKNYLFPPKPALFWSLHLRTNFEMQFLLHVKTFFRYFDIQEWNQ